MRSTPGTPWLINSSTAPVVVVYMPLQDLIDNILAFVGTSQPRFLLLLQGLFGFPAYGLLDSFVYGSMATMLCSSTENSLETETFDLPVVQPFMRTSSCGSELVTR